MPLIPALYKTHKAVRVDLDGRKFTVFFDEQNNPVRISERKKFKKPPLDCWYNAVYWSAKHHVFGKGDTMPKRIIEAARNAAS